MPNIYWFKPFNCENVLLFSVLLYFKLNSIVFLVMFQTKTTKDITQALRTCDIIHHNLNGKKIAVNFYVLAG